MSQTPSSSSELSKDTFNKAEWYKALGIIGPEPVPASTKEVAEFLKRAGDLIKKKYGPNVFQGSLGEKIAEDLKNLKPGAQFRVIESGFLMIVEKTETGAEIEIGFSGEPSKTALFEVKTRLNPNLDLKFLLAGD